MNIAAAKKDLNLALSNTVLQSGFSTRAFQGQFTNLVAGQHPTIDPTVKQMAEFMLDDFESLLFTMESIKLLSTSGLNQHSQKLLSRALIEHFHTQARSILDYLVPAIAVAFETERRIALGELGPRNCARLLRLLNTKLNKNPAQELKRFVPQKDFFRLRSWILKHESLAGSIFGAQMVTAMRASDWFPKFNTLRNDYTHKGAYLMVDVNADAFFMFYQFVEAGKPLNFLLDKALVPKPFFQGSGPQNGLVNFRLYGGLYLASVFALIESISDCLCSKLGLSQQGFYIGAGVDTAHDWMAAALAAL